MYYDRPIVLSIAGFDPSGGAGVLADIKVLEQHQCLGFAAVTAWTVQTENRFLKLEWLPLAQIKEQAGPLLVLYAIPVVRIGIIESLDVLLALVLWLKEMNPDVIIVWDTVLAASTGFLFINNTDFAVLRSILTHLFLITPNTQEARLLSGLSDEHAAAMQLSAGCNILLKGGHSDIAPGTDILYHKNGQTIFPPSAGKPYPKHGSGCILSSAIAANLAKQETLESACRKAKYYTEQRLSSNENLLAYHV